MTAKPTTRIAFAAALGLLLAASSLLADEEQAVTPQTGIGVRTRFVFIPTAVLDMFLGHSTPMSQWGVGAEVIRKKANFDIVFGLEYDKLSPKDGIYLESGHDPAVPADFPDYVHFHNSFALLGLDAAFIWHTDLGTPRVQLRYGGGIGVGVVLGGADQVDMKCDGDTKVSDLDNAQTWSEFQGSTDASHGSYKCWKYPPAEGGVAKDMSIPPVVPILDVILGVRVHIANGAYLDLEGGFRDMFFLGGSFKYFL